MATRLLAADSVDIVDADQALLAVGSHAAPGLAHRPQARPAGGSFSTSWPTTGPARGEKPCTTAPRTRCPSRRRRPGWSSGPRRFHGRSPAYRLTRDEEPGVALDVMAPTRTPCLVPPGAGAARARGPRHPDRLVAHTDRAVAPAGAVRRVGRPGGPAPRWRARLAGRRVPAGGRVSAQLPSGLAPAPHRGSAWRPARHCLRPDRGGARLPPARQRRLGRCVGGGRRRRHRAGRRASRGHVALGAIPDRTLPRAGSAARALASTPGGAQRAFRHRCQRASAGGRRLGRRHDRPGERRGLRGPGRAPRQRPARRQPRRGDRRAAVGAVRLRRARSPRGAGSKAGGRDSRPTRR